MSRGRFQPGRRRAARVLAGALLAAGASAAALSTTYDPYRDEPEFRRQVSAMQETRSSFDAYARVRDAALTPKYALLDYGLTAVAAAALLILFAELGSRPAGPGHGAVWGTANAAALASTSVVVGSLMLEATRDEYPPWADSLGLAFAAVPVLLLASLLFANVLTLPMRRRWNEAPLSAALGRGAGWWRPVPLLLRLVCAVNVASLAVAVRYGDFGSVLTAGTWLYVSALVLANVNGAARPGTLPAARRGPLPTPA